MKAVPLSRSIRAGSGPASEVIRSWAPDREFSVEAVLRERSELADHPSILVDLAYEEFCRLEESGRAVSHADFLARFPTIESALRRVLQLHELYCNASEVRDILLGEEWPELGTEFLGYRLNDELGRGLASRVYLAAELELAERLVVVKVGRGRQEATAMGVLQHPNIVPVLAGRTDEKTGLSLLAMPYLGRTTLNTAIKTLFAKEPPQTASDFKRAIGVEAPHSQQAKTWAGQHTFAQTVASVGEQLAAALSHAHSRGIIHSDIKPSNVLMTDDGVAMLLDFNLAQSNEVKGTNRGGTPAYMAPEQLAYWRNGRGASAAGDVFSLGVTLYELLVGRHPFGAGELTSHDSFEVTLLERHRRGPEPIPRERLQANRPLARLLEACLSFDPSARPTAPGLQREFQNCVSTQARLEQAVILRRRELLIALVAGVGVATSAGVVIARRPPRVEREWEAGLAAAEAGDYADAVSHFDVVVATRPNDAAALVARGWCRLQSGDFQLGYADVRDAHKLRPSGRTAALLGYALLTVRGDLLRAEEWFEQAIELGYDTPAVRNNVAYCCIQTKQLTEAEAHLSIGIASAPDLACVHHNLAMLDLRYSSIEGRAPDLRHIRRALEIAPESVGILHDAIRVFASACDRGESSEDELLQCCRSAVASGIDAADCMRLIRTYYQGATDSRFEVLKKERHSGPRIGDEQLRMARLCLPIEDFRDFLVRL